MEAHNVVVDDIVSPAGGIPEPRELSKKCFSCCKSVFYTNSFLTYITAFVQSLLVIVFSALSQRSCPFTPPNGGLYISIYIFVAVQALISIIMIILWLTVVIRYCGQAQNIGHRR